MSETLSDKPNSTTLKAQITKTFLLTGDRPKKMPIFISENRETRKSQAWMGRFALEG